MKKHRRLTLAIAVLVLVLTLGCVFALIRNVIT
jgi:hypothetical protein